MLNKMLPHILPSLVLMGVAGCAGLPASARLADSAVHPSQCDMALQPFAPCGRFAGWQAVQMPGAATVTTMVVSAAPATSDTSTAKASPRSLGLEVMLVDLPNQAGGAHGAPGLLVMEVMPGGAAQSAGLRRGDIILAFGGTPVAAIEAVQTTLTRATHGTRLAVELWRDQKPMVATLVF